LNTSLFIHDVIYHATISSKQEHAEAKTYALGQYVLDGRALSDKLYNLLLLFSSVNDNFNGLTEFQIILKSATEGKLPVE
jgi:hypothetical protein